MNRISNKAVKRRIIQFSKEHNLSHLGSCLGVVDIIKEIYEVKAADEEIILSAGHGGIALFAVIESRGGRTMEEIWAHHGNIHPDYCADCGISCSSGSLGHGLGISCGIAVSNREKNVYVVVTDGELAEGSCFEALRFAFDNRLSNLKIFVSVNGYGAYGQINPARITSLLRPFDGVLDITVILSDYSDFPFLRGLQGHYVTLTDETYQQAMDLLTE